MGRVGWVSQGLGGAVRFFRTSRGLNQSALAERLSRRWGLPTIQRSVSAVERGQMLNVDQLLVYAAALDVTPAALLARAWQEVPFGQRQNIVDEVDLTSWLYATRPLPGQDADFFHLHRPPHLLRVGGVPTTLSTAFLSFDFAAAGVLRAVELDDLDMLRTNSQSLRLALDALERTLEDARSARTSRRRARPPDDAAAPRH